MSWTNTARGIHLEGSALGADAGEPDDVTEVDCDTREVFGRHWEALLQLIGYLPGGGGKKRNKQRRKTQFRVCHNTEGCVIILEGVS